MRPTIQAQPLAAEGRQLKLHERGEEETRVGDDLFRCEDLILHLYRAIHGRHVLIMRGGTRVTRAASDLAEIARDARSARELRAGILDILHAVVGFDGAATLSATPGEPWVVLGREVDEDLLSRNYWRYSSEASHTALRAFSTSFACDTDVVNPRLRDRAAVYTEFHRPNGTQQFLARYWVVHSRIFVIGLSRASGRYRKRDLERLDRIFPQLSAAMRCGDLLGRDSAKEALSSFSEAYGLGKRQQEILQLLVRGLRNGEIGSLLAISENTVRNSIADIFRKTRVTTRSELVYIAVGFQGGRAVGVKEAQRALIAAVAGFSRATHETDMGPSTVSGGVDQDMRKWARSNPLK